MTTDDDLGARLGRSIDTRVRRLRARDDLDDLLERSEERRRQQRRRFTVGTTIIAIVVAVGAFALGTMSADDGGGDPTAVVIPRSPAAADIYAPDDLAQAGVEIANAYQVVFGPASDAMKAASIQLGPDLIPLLHRSKEIGARFGYTADQLKGNVVVVSAPAFIDANHATVQFSITIPGHGTVVKERVGYAVQTDGKWQVAARTVCDLVWPAGTWAACPARASS
jgi:hypothetical protein